MQVLRLCAKRWRDTDLLPMTTVTGDSPIPSFREQGYVKLTGIRGEQQAADVKCRGSKPGNKERIVLRVNQPPRYRLNARFTHGARLSIRRSHRRRNVSKAVGICTSAL